MKIISLAYQTVPGDELVEAKSFFVTPQQGILGDCRGAKPEEQITILSQRHWDEALSEVGCPETPWTARKARILVDDLELSNFFIGRRLKIGTSAVLELVEETTPCKKMERVCAGLLRALARDWRGGGRFKVLVRGVFNIEDEAFWLPPKHAQ
ncbi:MAG: hypothetical protein COV10_02565 [Candidatus Vogelbacteria bacterium CG10_big_fil_rev_8_21_14_0_10_51_16]|uniref:MOSC domain-containing protein n=1 Tax=Candidatus Vogelbacteria bacterium CG10_big_fil_rev_8_21_14_0_10_51_16 TaxID=1975045 RepID=A0A2H0RE28_9BACT|nr:MAG: hypothetical protein COV10_02565 [Candidatus Vogelbacteria bacterium CG10_big_fil_rev_8_21_14_0_10_51_16]